MTAILSATITGFLLGLIGLALGYALGWRHADSHWEGKWSRRKGSLRRQIWREVQARRSPQDRRADFLVIEGGGDAA